MADGNVLYDYYFCHSNWNIIFSNYKVISLKSTPEAILLTSNAIPSQTAPSNIQPFIRASLNRRVKLE